MSSEELRARLRQLTNMLSQHTEAGGIQWTETDKEGCYLYSASTASVLIEEHAGRYELSILNDSGNVVESLNAWEPDEETPIENDKLWRILQNLHESARRLALNIDHVLDSLIRDVQRGYSAPPPARGDEPPF